MSPTLDPRRAVAGARTRVLLAFVVLLALSTLVSTLALRQILLARTGERVEQSLIQEVEELERQGRTVGGDVRRLFDVFLARNVPSEGEAFFTFVDGRPYVSTEGAPSERLLARVSRLGAITATSRGEVVTADGDVRYLAVPVSVGERRRGVFVVAVNLGQERREVTEAVRVAAGVALAVLLVASALAWVIAGRVLAPLRTLRATAQSITETDFTRRIEVDGTDEIAELGRTFNAMLDRLESAFASQKALVSDAGHELRTPITIIRGHLELLGDDPDERRETVALVTDELDRMARFVEDLLLLARAEQGDFLLPGPLDLDVLTDEVFAKATALAPRDWKLSSTGTGRMSADRQRLTQAVVQLAQNAVQHTGPDDRIALGSALAGGEARLWVADSGPGIPPADRDRIFDRFHRAGDGRRRSDGAGLGLAIVRAIAEAHGGRVELDSREGAGSTFTLVIPAERPLQEVT
ncbi:MAG TPA: ATP-binding protein [Solirubrobacteraceae bacterium]|nr:ATP-binding protein [Solirubrobacteraceae bacterium]